MDGTHLGSHIMTTSAAFNFLQRFHDDRGAELVEWVVVISLIISAAVGVTSLLSDSLWALMTDLLNSI